MKIIILILQKLVFHCLRIIVVNDTVQFLGGTKNVGRQRRLEVEQMANLKKQEGI